MENIKYENGTLYLLDQTLLPNEEKYITPKTKEDYFECIKKLRVRGAPAIGIFAGYAMALLDEDKAALKKYLDTARPTAVNLSWATERMLNAYNSGKNLIDEAIAIHNEDKEMCRKISEYGLSLLHAYTDETRPLLQGARLTSYELEKAGVDVTLICDNMASLVMKQGKIDAVLVGTDRIAANGDIANKIGTSGVAVLAKYYNIPFYVLGPYSTIDYNCPTGDDIVIEERDSNEIKTMWYEKPMALPETKCYNPAFDVTDHELITAIITDRGIIKAPFKEGLERIRNND